MRLFPSGCAPVLVCMALLQGIVARKPIMIPDQKELLIQEGDELTIKCKGEGKLQFSSQWNMAGVRQSNFNISVNSDSGWYTFTRPKVTRIDTGWYACAEDGIEIQNDEQTIDHPDTDISWIYVYVNSSVPFASFKDVSSIINLVVMRGRPAVIPCRPTSPNLSVMMNSKFLRNPNPTYDPKIGFIVDLANEYEWSVLFTCEINETYGAEELWKQYLSKIVYMVKIKDMEPQIKPGAVVQAVLGQKLTLKCKVEATAAGSKVSLTWEPPKSVATERSSHYKTAEGHSYESSNLKTFSTTLTIDNLEETHLGEYTCVAKDLGNGATVSTATIVRIADPDVIPKEKLVYAYEGERVTLWCDAERKPLADFAWMKTDDSENYTFERRSTKTWQISEDDEGTPFLTFWHVDQTNNGTYECWTEDNNGRNISSRVSLIVFGKPKINSMGISRDVRPNSVLLRWKIIHDGNSPVKYYSIQHMRNNTGPWEDTVKVYHAENSRYLLTDLDESTEYEFKMTATNSIGVSSPILWSWSSTTKEDPFSLFNRG